VLTEIQIRKVTPKVTPFKLSDDRGMYLLVSPGGAKWWRLKYRFAGKEKLLSLGVYPDVSLKDARERRDAARSLINSGIDPSAQRKAAKRDLLQRHENTFSIWAEAWYAKKKAEWAPATAAKVRTYLDSDLLKTLGSQPIADITRPALVALLQKIESRDAHDVAKKCRGWLSGIFQYAQAGGIVSINPATDLAIVAASAPKRRPHAHLPIDELPAFLKALDSYAGSPEARHAIQMLLFTAVRPGELRGALWAEIDFNGAIWSIPAERMKMRRPHAVPLSNQAIVTLREMEKLTGQRELVFASPYKPRQPMSENTLNVAIARMGFKDRQTSHGFRHLISTALNEQGYNRDWIERQLAHGDDDEVRATYNKAEYLEQRRKMMQQWANRLDAMRKDVSIAAAHIDKAA